jgi:hypothetical protein
MPKSPSESKRLIPLKLNLTSELDAGFRFLALLQSKETWEMFDELLDFYIEHAPPDKVRGARQIMEAKRSEGSKGPHTEVPESGKKRRGLGT